MKRPEQAIHLAILRYLRLQYPRALIHHSPNELNLSGDRVAKAIAQNKAKALGMVPGFPDLFMLHNGVAWFFEVKAPGGKLSDNQRAVEAMIDANGGRWHVVRSIDDVVEALKSQPPGSLRGACFCRGAAAGCVRDECKAECNWVVTCLQLPCPT